MGLDQSFYRERPAVDKDGYLKLEQENEILYFRKYHNLHDFIDMLVDGAPNSQLVRLNPDDLLRLKEFIIQDEDWRMSLDFEERDQFIPNEKFFEVIGIFDYYARIDKPLYYMGDW